MTRPALTYRAGTATERVTPNEPLWLAGYAVRTSPARGTLSDLYASALSLDDGDGGRLVIASIDLIAITRTIADPVYEAVFKATGLPRERLILAATYTHYGPEFRPDKELFFNIPSEYASKILPTARRLSDALVRVILAALDEVEPVRLLARKTVAGFAHNRRRAGVREGTPSTEDVLDRDVPVIEAVRADGSSKAILFGYACHNTTIPPEDGRYCADWAGFAKEQIRAARAGTTPLFITGCAADQNPEPRGSVELSRQYGAELAEAVLNGDRDAAIEVSGSIRVAVDDVPLPLQPVTRQAVEQMLAAGADDPPKRVKARFLLEQMDRGEPLIRAYPAPMQAVRLGEQVLWIVMSGETVVDWSHAFKRAFADVAPLVWVAGYCNDMYGYLPTRRIKNEGGYEGGRANLWSWVPSPFTLDVEDTVTAAIRRLVTKVSA